VPGWATRLQTVFGIPPEEAAEEHLRSLVSAGTREYADLDFKQERYGNRDEDRRELAADIGQFANDRGGVIVIGIRDENEVAVELTPVPLDSDEEGRIRSIGTDNVVPYASFHIHVVQCDKDPTRGYYLVIVPPSADRPHAVRKGRDLRFPRRNGTQKRWLTESEVADAYRDRFTRIGTDLERVEQVMREGIYVTDIDPDEDAYLALALVPSQSGSFQVDASAVRSVEEWARGHPDLWRDGIFAGPFDGGGGPLTGVGVRRVRIGSSGPSGLNTTYVCAEVHSDGAVFVARRLMRFVASALNRMPSDAEEPDEYLLVETLLTQRAAECLRAAGRLSTEIAGAYGDCVVTVELHGPRLRLVQYDGDSLPFMVGRSPQKASLRSHHTLTLDSIASTTSEWLIATRLVCAELVQGFGAPELSTISPDGAVVRRAWPTGYYRELETWSQQHGLTVS
jgi:hypothetical protein